jgi:hypothetical protein
MTATATATATQTLPAVVVIHSGEPRHDLQKNHSLQPLLPPLAHFVHRDVGIDYLLVDAVDAIPCGFRQAQCKAF